MYVCTFMIGMQMLIEGTLRTIYGILSFALMNKLASHIIDLAQTTATA